VRFIVWRTLVALAVIVAIVVAVVLIRTLGWQSAPIAVEPIPKIAIDDGAPERFAAAIRLPTISRPESPESDFSAFDSLHRHLTASFPKVHAALSREVIGGHSLLYTWKGKESSAKPVLLLAHTDVVPVESGTEPAWSHPPFSGDIADGFIWGRGALDDKVSVLAILEAVETLLGQGFQPLSTIFLAFGHDEEISGAAGAARIAAVLKSRGIHAKFALDEGSVITDGIVPGLKQPAALIGIAEKGYASVELSTVSPGGHSSMPPPETAIGIVAAAVHAVESHPMPASLDGPAALLFDYLGPEMPFATRMALANRWLFGGLIVRQLTGSPPTNAVVRTTTAATLFAGGVKENVLPAQARAVINFRIKPGDSVESIMAHVREVVGDERVKISLLAPDSVRAPSIVSSVTSSGFATIDRTIRQVFPGTLVAPSLVVAGTDSRLYQDVADDVYRFQPFVLGPDDTKRIHGANERVAVDGYRDCVRFYVQLLINESKAAK
jgi:carboxypeptidase PM20D1